MQAIHSRFKRYEIMRVKIKVCGMKYANNILEVAALSPDFMGFIFYPKSIRYVGDNFVLPPISSAIKKVGVFVDKKADAMIDAISRYELDYVQLHGNESVCYCNQIRNKAKIIKAFGIDDSFDFSEVQPYAEVCDYFLFDTKTPLLGGSGQRFNRSLLPNYTLSTPFFLSGGLDSVDAKDARSIHPMLYALDVNSKFEDQPALKNSHKLKSFIHELSSK
jgi:phosphoribosylanthranilate isomerase